jgi:uncharacterized protein (DUF433 family)
MKTSARARSSYDLIARCIRPEHAYPGDPEAYVVERQIPVWALVGHWRAAGRDAKLTASEFQVKPDTVEAAIAYYRLHRDLIDARLAANQPA